VTTRPDDPRSSEGCETGPGANVEDALTSRQWCQLDKPLGVAAVPAAVLGGSSIELLPDLARIHPARLVE